MNINTNIEITFGAASPPFKGDTGGCLEGNYKNTPLNPLSRLPKNLFGEHGKRGIKKSPPYMKNNL